MDEWRLFLKEGKQYLKAGSTKPGRVSRLGSDVRYNLLSMSLEKSLMAVMLRNDDLADNHTFTDLISSAERHVRIPAKLKDEIIALEQVQSICNLYDYHRGKPADEVVFRLQEATAGVYTLAENACLKEVVGNE